MLALLLILYSQVFVPCKASSVNDKCRSERQIHLSSDVYKSDTCARCYKYMPSVAFHSKLVYIEELGLLRDPHNNITHSADYINATRAILDSFMEQSFAEKWKACCRAAWECCKDMTKNTALPKGTKYCSRTWDGWQCWPDTLVGTTAKQPCQDHIYFENNPPSCTKYAQKVCLSNGTWFRNEYFREWTNYTTCGRRQEHRQYLTFHVSTYIISMVSILPALLIFQAYKQLQVPRIQMHKNLFLSLLLNGLFTVLFKCLVVGDEFRRTEGYKSIMDRNYAGCKFLLLLTKYFRMSTYMWMFCEGFYLQKLIAATFAEQRNLVVFYVIGWAMPLVPVGVYAILRMNFEDEKCWAFPVEIYELIMNIPNLLSLLANLFFLCNIIRVLVTKLRATHAHEPSQYRKAVRATLVLIPLFGLHLGLVLYRPHSGRCGFIQAYTYLHYAMDGLQGFMVALIFCYLNGEVLYLLRKTYQRFKLNHEFRKNSGIMRRWSTTLTTVSDTQNPHPNRSRDHKQNNRTEAHRI